MIGPLGRLGAAATLGQHCSQMTQIRCIEFKLYATHDVMKASCMNSTSKCCSVQRIVENPSYKVLSKTCACKLLFSKKCEMENPKEFPYMYSKKIMRNNAPLFKEVCYGKFPTLYVKRVHA